jgi:hypothetical protein
MEDLKILTVGRDTYASDQRFQVVHVDNSDAWTLQIGYPTQKDSGVYKCQVSTNPPKSRKILLNVLGKFSHKYINGKVYMIEAYFC